MKWCIVFLTGLFLFTGMCLVQANAETETVSISESAKGLDLQAVSELFKESESVEAFEQALNDPENGLNNLDLDENGEVDFIRVTEEVSDDMHILVLQAVLGDDEYQDVAVIEIEKTEDEYNMQIQGNEDLYGPDYYIVPVAVKVHTWPIVAWLYRPAYKPYVSVYRFGYYPKWWVVRRPLAHSVYVKRTVVWTGRAGFKFVRTGRIVHTRRVVYKPRSSVLVKRKVVHTPHGTKVTKTTVTKKPGQPPVVKKKVVKKKR